jgi:hypothetical protein
MGAPLYLIVLTQRRRHRATAGVHHLQGLMRRRAACNGRNAGLAAKRDE